MLAELSVDVEREANRIAGLFVTLWQQPASAARYSEYQEASTLRSWLHSVCALWAQRTCSECCSPARTATLRAQRMDGRSSTCWGCPLRSWILRRCIVLCWRTPDMGSLRLGNIMSRLRMLTLYDQSVAFDGLVMGTGNRTEWLLGYFTLYGDGASALKPISHLYKCQVRALSSHLGIRMRSYKGAQRRSVGRPDR